MKKLILLAVSVVFVCGLSAQNSLSLTFKGQDQGGAYIQLDSVQIQNLTREWSETLIYPDTELIMTITEGIEDYFMGRPLKVCPNPFNGTVLVSVESSVKSQAQIMITDICGRICAEYRGELEEGSNNFAITLSVPQIYIMTVQTSYGRRGVRLVNTGYGSCNSISPAGNTSVKRLLYETEQLFVLGDEMRYTGFATIEGDMRTSVVITQEQMEDDTIGLVFYRDRIPCSDMPTVTDHEGNVYSTVQIGPQCWTRENMRVTTSPTTGTCLVTTGAMQLSYSGKMARWYNNDSTTYAPQGYGLLYNWNAAVDTFNVNQGELSVSSSVSDAVNVSFAGPRRGICPEGWHLPSAAEWIAYVNYVKAEGIYACDNAPNKIAKAFASQTGWNSNSTSCAIGQNPAANDALNFTALPAGYIGSGGFISKGENTGFWSVSQTTEQKANTWELFFNNTGIYQTNNSKLHAYSVRCVRD